MGLLEKLNPFQASEEEIISNKQAGKIYVADFGNQEGKYISAVFDDPSESYDVGIKILPKIEVRITYIIHDNKISGVQISKLFGKKLERINLSTLGFEGVLGLLKIFSNLELLSIANKSIILDSSVIDDEVELRRHLMTILADERGSKILAEIASSATKNTVESTMEFLKFLNTQEKIDPKILAALLRKLSSAEKINEILTSFSEIELDNISAAHKHQSYTKEITNLKKLLYIEEKGNIVADIKNDADLIKYSAGKPEIIFQNWIENNLWVFGVEYIRKYDARKIAIFSEGDLLMESMDGFLDLIELKRPKLEYNIFNFDSSHKSYYPSSDLSQVIGQCLFYLQKLDEYKLNLEKEYKVKIIRPRIKIIAGRSNYFEPEKFEALRMLNSNLNHIQIITYDYLVDCGEKIISNYK